MTIPLSLPFQKGQYFFPHCIQVRLKGGSSLTKQSLEKKIIPIAFAVCLALLRAQFVKCYGLGDLLELNYC